MLRATAIDTFHRVGEGYGYLRARDPGSENFSLRRLWNRLSDSPGDGRLRFLDFGRSHQWAEQDQLTASSWLLFH